MAGHGQKYDGELYSSEHFLCFQGRIFDYKKQVCIYVEMQFFIHISSYTLPSLPLLILFFSFILPIQLRLPFYRIRAIEKKPNDAIAITAESSSGEKVRYILFKSIFLSIHPNDHLFKRTNLLFPFSFLFSRRKPLYLGHLKIEIQPTV